MRPYWSPTPKRTKEQAVSQSPSRRQLMPPALGTCGPKLRIVVGLISNKPRLVLGKYLVSSGSSDSGFCERVFRFAGVRAGAQGGDPLREVGKASPEPLTALIAARPPAILEA